MSKGTLAKKAGLVAAPLARASCSCLAVVVALLAVVLNFLFLPPTHWSWLPYIAPQNVTGTCQGITWHIHKTGFWEDTEDKDKLVRSGALAAVLQALRRHPDNVEVQRACIDSVSALVAGVDRHQFRATILGGVWVILQSMKRFSQEPAVLGVGSTTLGCLCDFYHPNSYVFGLFGAREFFIQALKDHSNNPGLLFQLYCGLTGMTCHNVAVNNDELARLGLIEIGIQHMRAFPDDHNIREEVQPVLSCLTRSPYNEKHKQHILEAGFLPEVLSAMRDFPADQRLVSKGLESIRDFSINRPDVGRDLRKAGVFDVIVESMSHHKPLTQGAVFWNVHASGAQALNVLGGHDVENRNAMLKAGCHKQLLRSLEGDNDAKRAACSALRHMGSLGPQVQKQMADDGIPSLCLFWH